MIAIPELIQLLDEAKASSDPQIRAMAAIGGALYLVYTQLGAIASKK